MTRFEELLGTDFARRPTGDVDGVIHGGYDHAEHRERVPGLVSLLGDPSAADRERYLACLALVAWGEPVGYETVRQLSLDPRPRRTVGNWPRRRGLRRSGWRPSVR
ncbi:hypothetical protein ACFWNQ_32775 [Streptomyces virginiae]|uniref:hypothetical protein n=1 Tax=Streptomyces virginiae TaxID=1961 RepID=UPI0036574CE3